MDVTYTSLSGLATGCINFFGFSTISTLEAQVALPPLAGQAVSHVLVFEYANAGNIRDFLRDKLPKTSFQESWELVLSMLESIAVGIYTLHRHGVIHR